MHNFKDTLEGYILKQTWFNLDSNSSYRKKSESTKAFGDIEYRFWILFFIVSVAWSQSQSVKSRRFACVVLLTYAKKILDKFYFRWLEKKRYRDREGGMKIFDFQPSKLKSLLALNRKYTGNYKKWNSYI